MQEIQGYEIKEKIYEDKTIVIFRGNMIGEGSKPVIIKTLNAKTANLKDASKLVYEYEITRRLNIDGILKIIRLEQVNGVPALIMEDTGVIFLKKYLEIPLSHMPTIFSISMQLVETIGKLHRNGVIHRNLKLDSIVIEPSSGHVQISDLSMAVEFSNEIQDSTICDMPIGALPYMSPEQTGILNRAVDYRSDYYSLGVILYEITTGRFPLYAKDSEEWIYAHVAQPPQHLREINPDIPKVFSQVVMKLISKNPEKRYQSAKGLLWDIKECQRQWTAKGKITPFTLGRMDLPGRLNGPSKLFGRKKEAGILKSEMDRVYNGQSMLVFVHGYAGVGKTALVDRIIKPLAVKKGFYIYGKCDQLQRKMPYAPLIEAFGKLMRQILSESHENLSEWKEKLLRALGDNGAVITEIIPEVELVIGPQSPVKELKLQEAQNRFRMTFRNFISVFAQRKHPLVLFLDDLQWVDTASLQLLKYLCQYRDNCYLLLIGAYRENEVTGDHPLISAAVEIKQAGIEVRYIPVKPLDLYDTCRYIADVLHSEVEKVHSLAGVFYRKTAGNPFFLEQLLQVVLRGENITFNAYEGYWIWDVKCLQKMGMPEDVVRFLTGKLKVLPENTRNVLEISAYIGNTFSIEILGSVCEMTISQTAAELQLAAQEGLVLPRNDASIFLPESDTGEYEFLHDCVRQAAYSLLTERQKKKLHLKIGRLMLKNVKEEKLEDEIISIMDQLNRGLDLVTLPEEKIKLAGFNLLAGRKAKDSTAYDAAANYFKSGIALLPENSWIEHYQLTYALYLERLQCEYLCGRLDEADRLFDLILEHVRTDVEKADVYSLKMALNSCAGDYLKAVQYGLMALRHIGYILPAKPGKAAIFKEIILFKWHMRGKKLKIC